jgi:hypothetical protein
MAKKPKNSKGVYMTTTVIKNSLEMSYKLLNDMGKEVRRNNSIPLDINSTEENMLDVSKAVNKIMQYVVTDTVIVKRIMLVE